MSAIESLTNVVVGVGLAFGCQVLLFDAMGIRVSLHENIVLTVVFTAISLVRSYALRRLFEYFRCRVVD